MVSYAPSPSKFLYPVSQLLFLLLVVKEFSYLVSEKRLWKPSLTLDADHKALLESLDSVGEATSFCCCKTDSSSV